MSGHSHYSTIKRQKEAKDAKKGQMFSKLAKAIQIAVKSGGSDDPGTNYKLRMAIDTARASNMPKESIERAITKGSGSSESIEEVTYEGFGPSGIGIIIETATDNRNRTGQEIKNILEKNQGSMGGPGSVSFNFEPKGLLVLVKDKNSDKQILSLIDLGVEDVVDTGKDLEVYVDSQKTHEFKKGIVKLGYNIQSTELVKKPKTMIELADPEKAKKTLKLLDLLEEHDDVQLVYTNIDIPEGVIN